MTGNRKTVLVKGCILPVYTQGMIQAGLLCWAKAGFTLSYIRKKDRTVRHTHTAGSWQKPGCHGDKSMEQVCGLGLEVWD